ncbi:hypothetical protein NQ314_012382 [Rhamnusium bicolor]|uniref:DDE-1 domain-containing protein n=1 Tax=Rhamnusium bicolor TaxID=1586634 RepID=A0AAV8XD40_9CUCU|nr:hypothetical protein NQ314_012382 [Rhamnusium bicolor]
MNNTRVAQNLTSSRAAVKKQNRLAWFEEVLEYLKENGYDHILQDPVRVFKGDETAFFLNPKGKRVLAAKGDKNIYQQINNDEKECLTVLITGNASGQLAPPLIVFKYERIPQGLACSVPGDWGIGKSESGWMTSALFYEFLTNVFYPWLVVQNITFPVILFIEGYTSHVTLHSSKFCEEKGIILVALYPNATHLLQPMDVAVFRALKENWKGKVHQWRIKNIIKGNIPILKKRDFPPLLKEVLDETITPKNT